MRILNRRREGRRGRPNAARRFRRRTSDAVVVTASTRYRVSDKNFIVVAVVVAVEGEVAVEAL